ncbi:MAG TPA: amidohydrolase family protein, partial [Candidatus Brocadiia bacterium]|nr:amidohydrolase family protein [Candidatus Brocadiia bacterium]
MFVRAGYHGLPPYEDHIGLWARDLSRWVPERVFDGHVHLGPPEAMGALSARRAKEPLCTFASLTWDQLRAGYGRLFSGKRIEGLIAFRFPLREVDVDASNDWLAGVMAAEARVKGFFLAHPTDAGHARATFDRALARGARFRGAKPYFDFLGKSNYETAMPEFIPAGLLDLLNAEGLVMMLHTSGRGMGVAENQDYLRRTLEGYPRLRIILAHMGRYLEAEDFFRFADSGLLEHPRLYLEMSSASRRDVYERALAVASLRDRLIFGSDAPFGCLTGVEAWSRETGPVF